MRTYFKSPIFLEVGLFFIIKNPARWGGSDFNSDCNLFAKAESRNSCFIFLKICALKIL